MTKPLALAVVAGTLFLAGCSTPRQAARWEYQTVLDSDASADKLNQLGAQGWKVISFNPYAGPDGSRHIICLLQRPK